jgi:hypothetical protein
MQPAPQDIQLMPKHRVLRFEPQLRLERRAQDGQIGDSITSSTRIRFSVHTGRATRDISVDLRGALTTPRVNHRAAITDPVELGALLRVIEGYV